MTALCDFCLTGLVCQCLCLVSWVP